MAAQSLAALKVALHAQVDGIIAHLLQRQLPERRQHHDLGSAHQHSAMARIEFGQLQPSNLNVRGN